MHGLSGCRLARNDRSRPCRGAHALAPLALLGRPQRMEPAFERRQLALGVLQRQRHISVVVVRGPPRPSTRVRLCPLSVKAYAESVGRLRQEVQREVQAAKVASEVDPYTVNLDIKDV